MSVFKGVKSEVTVKVTAELFGDYGKMVRVPFKATYKKLPVDEAKKVLERVQDDTMSDDEVIADNLVRWRELYGADDNEIEFCDEALTEAMNYDGYRKALVQGFMAANFGKQARQKNS